MPGAAYDAIATWYEGQLRQGSLLAAITVSALLDLSGDVTGRRVCDLACGQGEVARALARRGARVTGADISAGMLAVARRSEQSCPLCIDYVQVDAQGLDGLADAVFDGVTCNMSLMDIPDLVMVFAAVARVLRPDGWFIFSITHPCFQTPGSRWVTEADTAGHREIRRYFEEGEWRSDYAEGLRGRVGAWHRKLETYLNRLIDAGFILERLIEPRPPEGATPAYSGDQEVPSVLLVRSRKTLDTGRSTSNTR